MWSNCHQSQYLFFFHTFMQTWCHNFRGESETWQWLIYHSFLFSHFSIWGKMQGPGSGQCYCNEWYLRDTTFTQPSTGLPAQHDMYMDNNCTRRQICEVEINIFLSGGFLHWCQTWDRWWEKFIKWFAEIILWEEVWIFIVFKWLFSLGPLCVSRYQRSERHWVQCCFWSCWTM